MLTSIIIDKYAHSCNLKRLEKNGNKWNAECPVCKEGSSSGRKKRFWILQDIEKTTVYCFNCGLNTSFLSFIKNNFSHLYLELRKEVFLNKEYVEKTPIIPITENKNSIIDQLTPLKESREGLLYCKGRKLTKSFVLKSYYSDNYIKFLNENKLAKYEYVPTRDPRIVMPIFQDKVLRYLQGRSIKNSGLRYINIQVTPGIKIWNYDNLDWDKPVYLFEGVFDACYFENSGAMLTSGIDLKRLDTRNLIVVLDNDININKDIKKKAFNFIKAVKIVIMPNTIKEKDINEMILNGYTKEQIKEIIDNNIFSGVSAKVRLKIA